MKRWMTMAPLGLLFITWLGLVLGDSFMRIERFRWHDRLIRNPPKEESAVRGPDKPMVRRVIPEFSGGDLTRLAAVDDVLREYGETKPGSVILTDEAGYRNEPPTDGIYFPVMIVGDSFMDVRFGEDGSYPEQLRKALGVPVYNHAFPGSGAFWGLHRYLLEGRFIERPPEVIVWGLLEREIAGGLFSGYVYHIRVLKKAGGTNEATVARGGNSITWDQLRPRTLKTTLPNTSYFSAAVNRLWNVLRYKVFGSITKDVIVSKPDASGKRYLFYGYNLEAMAWTPEQRNAPQAAYAIEFIRDSLRERGSELVVVLIPDKAQVYRELIPDRFPEFPPCTLIEFEDELKKRDIPVVNLYETFRKQALGGMSLYWRDDTHWRPESMATAAGMTAEAIRENGLLKENDMSRQP